MKHYYDDIKYYFLIILLLFVALYILYDHGNYYINFQTFRNIDNVKLI